MRKRLAKAHIVQRLVAKIQIQEADRVEELPPALAQNRALRAGQSLEFEVLDVAAALRIDSTRLLQIWHDRSPDHDLLGRVQSMLFGVKDLHVDESQIACGRAAGARQQRECLAC